MTTTTPTPCPVHDKPPRPPVPPALADHPNLFDFQQSGLPDWQGSGLIAPASTPTTATTVSSTGSLPASGPAVLPSDPAPTTPPASSSTAAADDDLDEIDFPSAEPEPPLTASEEIRQVNTGWLKPHELSVGIYGGALADKELVASVKDRGILTPLQVTPDGIVISGHRRLQAAKEAWLRTVPVYVRNPKGNRVGDIEEQILEANRQRKRTPSR